MTVIMLDPPDRQDVDLSAPEQTLESFKPFEGLTSPVLETIREAADFRFYKAGETLVSHGQYEGEAFYIVAEGDLKVTVVNPASGAVYIEAVSEGRAFGLDIALAQNSEDVASSVTLTAETDTSVWVIDSLTFIDIVSNRPSLAKNLLFFMSTEFLESRFKLFEFSAAPELSIHKVLLELAERDELSGEWKIQNLPKHRELAELADVDEEDVASAVALLIQENIARREYPGLVICDMTRLSKLSQ